MALTPKNDGSGTASAAFQTSDLALGNHTIVAIYSGDDNFSSSESTDPNGSSASVSVVGQTLSINIGLVTSQAPGTTCYYEGDLATLPVNISNLYGAAFTVTVDWGDGNPAEKFGFAGGEDSASVTLTHLYNAGNGTRTISAEVTPTDPSDTRQASATTPVTVYDPGRLISTAGTPDSNADGGYYLRRHGLRAVGRQRRPDVPVDHAGPVQHPDERRLHCTGVDRRDQRRRHIDSHGRRRGFDHSARLRLGGEPARADNADGEYFGKRPEPDGPRRGQGQLRHPRQLAPGGSGPQDHGLLRDGGRHGHGTNRLRVKRRGGARVDPLWAERRDDPGGDNAPGVDDGTDASFSVQLVNFGAMCWPEVAGGGGGGGGSSATATIVHPDVTIRSPGEASGRRHRAV